MEDNSEYCTGQEFQIVFTSSDFRLWQCKQCAYELPQRPISDATPSIPVYHPKPITKRFTVSEEQKTRLTVGVTIKQMIEQREKRLDVLKSAYPLNLEVIGKVEHGIMTLIELEHKLRLCDCPDEAYK